MSWLAVTFTTQEINSLILILIYLSLSYPSSLLFLLLSSLASCLIKSEAWERRRDSNEEGEREREEAIIIRAQPHVILLSFPTFISYVSDQKGKSKEWERR